MSTFRPPILRSGVSLFARCARAASSRRAGAGKAHSAACSRPRPLTGCAQPGGAGPRSRPAACARNPSRGPVESSRAPRMRRGRLRPVKPPEVGRSGRADLGSGLEQALDPAALSRCSPGRLLRREEGLDRAGEGGGKNKTPGGQRSRERAPARGGRGGRRERALSSWQRIPSSRNRTKTKREKEKKICLVEPPG